MKASESSAISIPEENQQVVTTYLILCVARKNANKHFNSFKYIFKYF